jgi:hypothetical protein
VGTPFLKVKIQVLQHLPVLLAVWVGQQACLVLAVLLVSICQKICKRCSLTLRQKTVKAVNANAVLLNAAEAAGNVNTRNLGKGVAAGLVPASALTAGLGGVALGAIPGSMGIPGFQQNVITDNVITDPEYPGRSSNTSMARASTPTLRYLG